MGTWIIIIAVALVLLTVILRKKSVTTITHPAETKPAWPGAAKEETPAAWTGSYNGVAYTVECLGHSMPDDKPIMTVWIDLPEPTSQQLEVNAREKQPNVPKGKREEDIKALLALGITYIDIGYNTGWLAAEMATGKNLDHALAELVAKHLIRLRELSK